MPSLRTRIVDATRKVVRWGHRRVPWGVRSALGVPLILGGTVGFLPVLGFWMIPAGLAFIALDIPPLRRRVVAWAEKGEGGANGGG